MSTPTSGLEELRGSLLSEHTDTLDPDRLDVIEQELRRLATEQVPGAVVELGCYRGAMALWMRAVLDDSGQRSREVHVYDSFQGLPAPGPLDPELFAPGDLRAQVEDVQALHRSWGRGQPVIHAGWFEQTLPHQLPEKIAFAYLDGDYYNSIRISLSACVPRLTAAGALIVDDYADLGANPRAWNGLPGVKAACDDFFGSPSPVTVVLGRPEGDLAFGRYTPVPGERFPCLPPSS